MTGLREPSLAYSAHGRIETTRAQCNVGRWWYYQGAQSRPCGIDPTRVWGGHHLASDMHKYGAGDGGCRAQSKHVRDFQGEEASNSVQEAKERGIENILALRGGIERLPFWQTGSSSVAQIPQEAKNTGYLPTHASNMASISSDISSRPRSSHTSASAWQVTSQSMHCPC